MPDQVHLLIEVDPQFGIHRAVKRFKKLLRVPYAKVVYTIKTPRIAGYKPNSPLR